MSEAAAKAANSSQSDALTLRHASASEHGGAVEQQVESVRRTPQAGARPFDEARLQRALAIAKKRGNGEISVGIQRRCQHRGGAPAQHAAGIRGAAQEGFESVCAGHHPAEEEAAMTVGPNEGERREQPEPEAILENGDPKSREKVRQDRGTIMSKLNGQRRGCQASGHAPEHRVAAASGNPAGQRASRGEEQSLPKH